MLCTAQSFVLDGISAQAVRVEVDVGEGLPSFHVAGVPDAATRESRERIRAALLNSSFEFPLRRIAVSIGPATRSASPGLDLAIALALLGASKQIAPVLFCSSAVIGELALDGSVRGVRGVVAFARAAAGRRQGIVVPAENGSEATLVKGVEVAALDHLRSLAKLAPGREALRPEPLVRHGQASGDAPDLRDLRGQPSLRRALEVAAAGGHNLLMIGVPGSGTTVAAGRLPSILPPPSEAEALEIAQVASCTGRPVQAAQQRPFRAPHHTISPIGLAGGRQPGEVTLAHRGVLYLDDVAKFGPISLSTLETALEFGEVFPHGTDHCFPACPLLVGSAPPCPCGSGASDPDCECSSGAISRYLVRAEAALQSMFEIHCHVEPPTAAEIGGPPGESSAAVRERVCAARKLQAARLGEGVCNADMGYPTLNERELDSGALAFLGSTVKPQLRGAAFDRLLRVSQTLADLDGSEEIGRRHLEEGLSLICR